MSMVKWMFVFVSFVFLLATAAAQSETYRSNQYGFSANFPVGPIVSEPKGSEVDREGNFIATMVMFTGQSSAPTPR